MRRITLVILHAFVAQAHAKEPLANEAGDVGDTVDNFADKLASRLTVRMQDSIDHLVIKLVDTLFDQATKPYHIHEAELDNTTLGKPAQSAISAQQASLLPNSLLASRSSTVSHAHPFSVPMLAKPDLDYAPAFSKSCPRTSYTLYTQLRRQHGLAPPLTMCAAGDEGESTVKDTKIAEGLPSLKGLTPGEIMDCDINNLEGCTASQLEVIYIDALWDYYTTGTKALSDDEFDQLKMELNWQGSGVPTLKRNEIKFVEASLAYARGEPILSDEEYEKLKNEIKSKGKRKEVTSFLLYVKGTKSLNADQFEKFAKQMDEEGIKISPTGADCVLADTPSELQNDVLDTIQMYTALGVVPTTICTGAYYILTLLLGGTSLLGADAIPGLAIAGLSSVALTTQLVRYLGLTSPQILKGTCPCCEAEIRQFASDFTGPQVLAKCSECATQVGFNAETLMIEEAGGFKYQSSNAAMQDSVNTLRRDFDILINKAALRAVQGVAGKSEGKSLGGVISKGKGKKKKATSKSEVIQKGLPEGIFAWAILLGYGLFGETFVGRVRGKGIAIHSGVINDFSNRFALPAALRQKYIQTAKRNGDDLGFLVDGEKQFGTGLFGEQAMKWWKEQGF